MMRFSSEGESGPQGITGDAYFFLYTSPQRAASPPALPLERGERGTGREGKGGGMEGNDVCCVLFLLKTNNALTWGSPTL